MGLPTHHLLLGLTLGALSATGIAAIGPTFALPAFADEPVAGAFNTAKLLHFQDRDVAADDSVSTSPLHTVRIKKVEHGQVRYVDITTTATGTYSTDGLDSPNVGYPGIEKHLASDQTPGAVAYWGPDGSWVSLDLVSAASFIHVRAGSNRIISGSGFSCIITRYSTNC